MLALEGRPEHIATLISGVDRYNPSNVHLLEDYLQQQLADEQYDLLANLALLKLYQFNPTSLSPTAALSILFLSLTHAPFAADFGLAWSLLSDSFVNGAALPPVVANDSDEDSDDDEPAKKVAATPKGEKETAQLLQSLSSLLQGRKFRQFWSAINEVQGGKDVEGQVEALKRDAKGWERAIRQEIAKEVELSFRSVKKETLAGFMGTQDFNEIAESRKWTIKDSDVQLPQNASNTPKSSVTHERIEIEQLARLLGRTQA
ncbi:uncharacterized protein JCM6883_003467 [Sporobolomyces salmoneus]|uniref:uncharacterized protein n=1 Tax=Sporobolomyces salmoneus TaxID=183962 RepID=UPI003171F613